MKKLWFCLAVVLSLSGGIVRGYLVGPAVPLEELTDKADFIFKGTAVTSHPVSDKAFEPLQGFICQETEFKIVSTVKGKGAEDRVRFRHYDSDPKGGGIMYSPQCYHFESGKTYLVFARKEVPGIFQQIWMSHTGKRDEGSLRCANNGAVEAATVKEIVWSELIALLHSADREDVVYAVGQLDDFSGGGGVREHDGSKLSEFDRRRVLAEVHGLMANPDPPIAQAVLGLVGSHNPYMAEDSAPFWLATVAAVPDPGLAPWDAKLDNVGGNAYRDELVAVADSKADAATRGSAVAALGLVREPALQDPVKRWLTDAAPEVRRPAVLLLADFPALAIPERMEALASDPAGPVRAAVAYVIGLGQKAALAGVLSRLLADKEPKVRLAAVTNLLSFSPKDEAVAAIFRDNLKNEDFAPQFLLALARDDPGKYRDGLAEAVEYRTDPPQRVSPQIPAYTAWHLLYKYLQGQPKEEVVAGKFDRYLNALEAVGQYGSSEPCAVYAFYLQRGMADRAKNFRAKANKAAGYDLDQYFKRVSANLAAYTGE